MVDYSNPYSNWMYQPSNTQVYPMNGNWYNVNWQKNQQGTVTQNTFQWVQGKAAAEAYLVAPGNSVILMDSNEPVIYYKSADQNGRYLPMKTYDLVERKDPENARAQIPDFDTSSFVRRDEIADLIAKEVDRQLAAPSK